jgi:hypothetical protein
MQATNTPMCRFCEIGSISLGTAKNGRSDSSLVAAENENVVAGYL